MTVVQNTVLLPDDSPAAGAVITVTLVDADGIAITGYGPDDSTVSGNLTFRADEAGEWERDFVPNPNIEPENTYYKVVEKPSSGQGRVHLIYVPATGGPYTLFDVLEEAPAPLEALHLVGPPGPRGFQGNSGAAYSSTIGDGVNTEFLVPHNLTTRDVYVALYLNAEPYSEIETDVEHTDLNTVRVIFGNPPGVGEFRIVVISAAPVEGSPSPIPIETIADLMDAYDTLADVMDAYDTIADILA